MATIPSTTSLKERIERIAALQQRASSPHSESSPQSSTSTGVPKPSANAFRDKIARFEEKGGTPVPKSTFGLWAPAQTMKRNNELYGNRIPSAKELSHHPKDQSLRPAYLAPSTRRLRSVSASDALFSSRRETCRETERRQDSDVISTLHIEEDPPPSPSLLPAKTKSHPPIFDIVPPTPSGGRSTKTTISPMIHFKNEEHKGPCSPNGAASPSDSASMEDASVSVPAEAKAKANEESKLSMDATQRNGPDRDASDARSTTPLIPINIVVKQELLSSVSLPPVEQSPPECIKTKDAFECLVEFSESLDSQSNLFSSQITTPDYQCPGDPSVEATASTPANSILPSHSNGLLSYENPKLDAFPIAPGHLPSAPEPPPVTTGAAQGVRSPGDRTSISSTQSIPSLAFSSASASSSTACSPTAISTNHAQQQPVAQPIARLGASLQRSKSHSRPKSYVPTWYDSDSDDGEGGWANVVVTTKRYY